MELGVTSRLYPRVITAWRPKAAGQVGDVAYNSVTFPDGYTQLGSARPASIQLDRQGQRNAVGLPTDARYDAIWKVFIPDKFASLGTFATGDVIQDDLQNLYQCFAPYWNLLGYRLGCIVLEV